MIPIINDKFKLALIGLSALVFLAHGTIAQAAKTHGMAMYGAPKYSADFTHFDYANPAAPRGGSLTLANVGSFDSLNPFIIKGVSPKGMGLVYERLMSRSRDEPFTLYGNIAQFVEIAGDRSSIIFTLNPKARFSDGSPITAEDVIFSFETLRDKGRPNVRTYYKKVTQAEILPGGQIKMQFQTEGRWEMPMIMGLMTVISKKYFTDNDFTKSSLKIPLGSGPYRIGKIDPGRQVQYIRDENYWAADLPQYTGRYNFQQISFDYYRDNDVAVEAFKAHEYNLRTETDAVRWTTGYTANQGNTNSYIRNAQGFETPAPMIAMAFNTRKPIFADARVRRALTFAFDFEWTNKNLLQNAYKRTLSYFDNSELAAKGLPGAGEIKLLEPFRHDLPPEIFTRAYHLPVNDGSGKIRKSLRRAKALLKQAGWTVKSGQLVMDGTAAPFSFEILLQDNRYTKIMGGFIKHLKLLGITANIRVVDTASYQNRITDYDFDMIVNRWGQSLSPGNEQAFYWTTEAAETNGTRNYPGMKVAAIDALIDVIVAARDRRALVSAIRALDRVMLWHHFVIPLYHQDSEWIVHWPEIHLPATPPIYGTSFDLWWHQKVD